MFSNEYIKFCCVYVMSMFAFSIRKILNQSRRERNIRRISRQPLVIIFAYQSATTNLPRLHSLDWIGIKYHVKYLVKIIFSIIPTSREKYILINCKIKWKTTQENPENRIGNLDLKSLAQIGKQKIRKKE